MDTFQLKTPTDQRATIMDTISPKPVLRIRHSRIKLIYPLMISQIIGTGLIGLIYITYNGMFTPSQYPLAVLGVAGGAFSYGVITYLSLSKMMFTDFLIVLENGDVLYSPGLKQIHYKFTPAVQWTASEGKIRLLDPHPGGSEKSFVLPPTINKNTIERLHQHVGH